MSLAALSLAALIAVLVISCISRVNIGVLAVVFAWILGVFLGGMTVEQVTAGFPAGLFLTLVALTLLFSQAQDNGTLQRLARMAVGLCRGNTGMIPITFFALTALLSAIGPGNIAATALMAPLAMAVAGRYRIAPFLMAIMVANGASAGSLSPIAPTGVIVNRLVADMGISSAPWTMFQNNLLIHTVVALCGYFLFGGLMLFRRNRSAVSEVGVAPAGIGAVTIDPLTAQAPPTDDDAGLETRHRLTAAVIAAVAIGAVAFGVNVGMAAFVGAVILTLTGAADDQSAMKRMPWNVILMVSGMTVLVSLLEKTGGLDLFSDFLARLATPATSTLVTAFFTGVVSLYSSTTGVVLPALIPTVPGLVERMGGGNVVAIISSMNSAGHLVDVSPLSTLGALCLAAAPPGTDTRRLFNQLMAWGVSMTVIGAIVCWIMFGRM